MKTAYRILSMIIMTCTLMSVLILPAHAASVTAFKNLSTNKYAKTYTITTRRTTPYTAKDLKQAGTETYGKSSSAFIDGTDELYVYEVGINNNGAYYARVSYPLSGTSKRATAYLPLSAITTNNGSHTKTTSTGKFYCSTRAGGATNSNYYVDKGDAVWLLTISGSNYQIMYPTSNGCYRIAWCTKANYTKYCGTSISLSSTTASIMVGSTKKITATVTNGSGNTTWTSSNSSVATVSGGTITAKNAGTCTITAKNNGKTAACKVTVTRKQTVVSLNTSTVSLTIGDTKKLTATVTNGSGNTTWMSSNTSIATVSSGTITAKKAGTCTITVMNNGKTATCTVTVQTNEKAYWDARVGTTVANIKSGSSYTVYYGSGNLSARGGYDGQCTWYAYGRFYEVNGVALKTAPNAKNWLSNNSDDPRVKVIYGASNIKSKSIAVRTSGTYGHVMFIEYVSFSANGSPEYVYFTECNTDNNGQYDAGRDCILQKMTYATFISTKNPTGYVCKA